MPKKNKKEEVKVEPKKIKKNDVIETPVVEEKVIVQNTEPSISEKREYLRQKKLNNKKYYSFNTRFIILPTCIADIPICKDISFLVSPSI